MAAFQSGIKIHERFEVITLIGRGGFGEVWQGVDGQLLRDIAIKRILGFGESHNRRQKMIEEAQKLASVPPHPHVVTIYDVFEYEREILVAMELLTGGSLEEYLKKVSKQRSWVGPSESFRLAKGILYGLAAAHSSWLGPIIHKDLKPSNILFDATGSPKLADFGIASLDKVDALPTSMRGLLEHEGTYGFKSPEQMHGGQLDHRTDLFSVGVILYLLFAGIHPFIDPRFLFDYRTMVLDPYRDLPQISDVNLPDQINDFLARLLATELNYRFQSAKEALDELEYVERLYQDLLFSNLMTFYKTINAGQTVPCPISVQEFVEGISLCKRRGYYAEGKFLYERSGVDFATLTELMRVRLDEDYGFCRRKIPPEG